VNKNILFIYLACSIVDVMMEIITIHTCINLKKGHIINILKENMVQPLLMSTSVLLLAIECIRMIA
jgi:hypothetical protein